jgi:predicted MFS family arabinose efflux permease
MTVLASATGIGYALGASVAGRLADATGTHTAAFGVTVTTTLLAVVLMVVSQRRLRAALAHHASAETLPASVSA